MMNGKMHKGWGARGNAKIALEIGKPGVISFDFLMADWSEEDKNLVSAAIVYNTANPPVFQSVTLSLDSSYSAIISKITIDLGCKPALRKDAAKTSGYLSAYISGTREPTVAFDPENILVATYDFMGKWKAGTLATLTATWGATPSAFALAFDHLQFDKIALAVRDGISTYDITANPKGMSGDDEWSLIIT